MTIPNYIKRILVPLMMLFFVQKIALGQCSALVKIIQSDAHHSWKAQKLDSLFLILEQNRNLSLAECYHDLGNMWYYRNWKKTRSTIDLENAIYYTKKAAQLKSEFVGDNSESYFQSLFNLGFFYKLDGSIYKSIDTFEKLIISAGNHRFAQFAMEDIGKILLEAGDFNKATEYFSELAEYYKKSKEWNNELAMHILLADTHGSMDYKEHRNTIEYHLRQADYIIKSQRLESSFKANQTKIIRGNLMLMTKDYKNAINQFNSINKEVFTNAELAKVHNNLSICQLKLGDISNSQDNLLKSIELDSTFSLPYENLGDLYLEKEEFNIGILYYQIAIHLLLGKNGNSSITDLPTIEELSLTVDKLPLLNHLTTKANGWIKYYEFDNNKEHLVHALETFALADQLVDLIRFESMDQQSKLFWREQGATLYMKAVEVCHLLNKPEEAFHFMERNKALLLLEDLTHEEAKDIAQLPQNLAQLEFKLKRSIFLAENDLFESGNIDQGGNDSLKALINENKYVYQNFIDSLNTAFPDYAKFKKKAAILSYEQLMSGYVSNQQLVLHYILNEDAGYGLLTGVAGSILFQLENPSHLSLKIDALTALLSSGISDLSTLKATSFDLFQTLIPAAVYDKIKDKRIIIIPDYTLQRIPFETLVVDTSETRYLMEDVEISYVYSMSLLNHNVGDTRTHAKQLLSFAPVNFDELELVALSHSESEISGIAPFFEGDVFLNENASKANFLKEVAEPKIIHLATHADIGDGENPWIAFSDEKMYLKEIYATKNQSDMVVLSACNTLSGDLKRGEGVMSLARGFFYSGAKSVVSSLWPLTDNTGSNIMISFYANLDKGFSKSKALREAKLDYINSNIVEELKHPFYWAGFVVVGDNAPLVASHFSIWIYIGMVFGLVILYLFGRRLWKRLQ